MVYTAIMGNKDFLHEPPVERDYDYTVFTDNPAVRSFCGTVILEGFAYNDHALNAKMMKVLPHQYFPNHEYSLWIDGSIQLKANTVDHLISRHLSHSNLAILRHPERDCIYDEAHICSGSGLDHPQVIAQQMDKYRKEGYPDRNGLVEASVILRRHKERDVVAFNEDWIEEVKYHSRRDQLSFNYVAWKQGFRYAEFPFNVLGETEDFIRHPHLR